MNSCSNNNLIFRNLNANEIECRIASVGSWGVQLLLYMTSRAPMVLLDETVGCLNWERSHQLIGDKLFCTIRVFNPALNCWISKSDVGTESFAEKVKGESSDSFKRAAVNFGIGRSLYDSPKIFIAANNLQTLKNENGKWKCNDYFKVADIQYQNNSVSYVKIYNATTKAYLEFWNQ